MTSECILNDCYNRIGLNRPFRIGYMMDMIRKLHPYTEEEWRIWYLNNVRNESYIRGLSEELLRAIPNEYNACAEECYSYICDVMFRRTFQGYNKEKQALRMLRALISPEIQEAPKEWDTLYFIDFYIKRPGGRMVGIQLKPDTFYRGNYQNVVDIRGKMGLFCNTFNAKTFVLMYKSTHNSSGKFELANPEALVKIKNALMETHGE